MQKFFNPRQVPTRPFRFRDNIVGIGCYHLHLPKLQRLFQG